MTRQITTIFGLLLALSLAASNNAAKLLNATAAKLTASKSITATFNITANGHKSTGEIKISGNKFYFNSPEMTVWYDGKTQWAMMKSNSEVNVTEPDHDELAMINPMIVIRNYNQLFNIAGMTNSASSKIVKLTAKSPSNQIKIGNIEIGNDKMPKSIQLTLNNKQQIKVIIKSLKTGNNTLPASTFVFDKRKHPNAEIIDLR